MMIVFTMTTTMVATGGFGAFPNNPLTQTFQTVISENVPADILQPFNSYMESISGPTIQPEPASDSEPAFDPLGDIFNIPTENLPSITETLDILSATAETLQLTLTETITPTITTTTTATGTGTLTSTSTPSPTQTSTSTGTATATVSSTATIPIIYPTLTRTSPPPVDTDTPVPTPTDTSTPVPTPTPTATALSTGFTFSVVNINGTGTSATVPAGLAFTVTFNFQVFSDACPSCITQLVTGLGTAGSQGATCAYNGIAGVFPGVTGAENVTLTAPVTAGTYNVVVVYGWQLNCADALTLYPNGNTSQIIGQVTVP
jgi:hypothetical protein